jgi:hypothetical protein
MVPSWQCKKSDRLDRGSMAIDPSKNGNVCYSNTSLSFDSHVQECNVFFYPAGMKRALGNLLDFRIIGQKANVLALQPSKSRASSVPYLRESRQTPRSLSLPCIADRVHW